MKRIVRFAAAALAVCACCVFASGCGKEVFTDASLAAGNIEVKVESAAGGKLPTVFAADREEASPRGQNVSPAVSWEAVDGAAAYAVCMTDTDESHLHMAAVVESTRIERGALTDEAYMGPYPEKGDPHRYRVEVFALRERTEISAGVDAPVDYIELIKGLNKVGKRRGNILARGKAVVTYRFGDDTPESEG